MNAFLIGKDTAQLRIPLENEALPAIADLLEKLCQVLREIHGQDAPSHWKPGVISGAVGATEHEIKKLIKDLTEGES